jgi:hypothetical protein
VDATDVAKLKSANRFIQAHISETITISGTNYTCSEGESFLVDLGYETGGATLVEKGSVVVNKDDLATPPERGSVVTFRSAGYRVTIVDDLVATWDIHLIQLSD